MNETPIVLLPDGSIGEVFDLSDCLILPPGTKVGIIPAPIPDPEHEETT